MLSLWVCKHQSWRGKTKNRITQTRQTRGKKKKIKKIKTNEKLIANVLLLGKKNMTDPESSYRPRSPDFSSLQSFPNTFNNTYQPQPPFPASPLDQRASYDASPFFAGGYQPPVVNNQIPQPHFQQPFHYNPAFDDMSRRSARISAQSNAQSPPLTHLSEHNFIFDEHVPAVAPKALNVDEPQPKPWDGVDVRTKFPVARIKRIMQADEEVGKVAQVTPIAVCTLHRIPFSRCADIASDSY